ncbi:MAG: hypothetical protein ACRDZX_08555 [Acidimicrobiales bacterium]
MSRLLLPAPLMVGLAALPAGAAIAATATAGAAPAGAAPAGAARVGAIASGSPNRSRPPAISLRVSDLYKVGVYSGSWVPIAVTVTDRGPATVQGKVVVRSPISPLSQLNPENCFVNNLNTICSFTGTFSYASAQGFASTAKPVGGVDYELPLDITPGTTKRMVLYVLGEPQHSHITAELLGPSGKALARAGARLAVGNSIVSSVMLLVTDVPQLASWALPSPDGTPPQVETLAPADLPD